MGVRDVETVVTTAQFREGQAAAWQDHERESAGPNDAVLGRMHPEFAAGYRYEWREYIEPILPSTVDDID